MAKHDHKLSKEKERACGIQLKSVRRETDVYSIDSHLKTSDLEL
jgi:hypothetical protein